MSSFSEYVTGTSFSLSLSRRQIDMLCQLDQYSFSYGLLTTCGALVSKGLVERRFAEDGGKVVLTEAGRAVIPLLKLAGLYVTYPPMPSTVDLPPIELSAKPKEPDQERDCHVCGGDCSSANPPVLFCPMRKEGAL